MASRRRGFERAERDLIVAALISRDGPACGACLLLLDFAITDPHHPALPTIDHITPMSEGGDHGTPDRLDNLRMTHGLCNESAVKVKKPRPTWFARRLQLVLDALPPGPVRTKREKRSANVAQHEAT
jgi:hypothetical protein